MTYLIFEKINDEEYNIRNKKQEEIGSLEYIRVGAWKSWCLCPAHSDIYISASCLDEIREKIKKLNASRFKNKQED